LTGADCVGVLINYDCYRRLDDVNMRCAVVPRPDWDRSILELAKIAHLDCKWKRIFDSEVLRLMAVHDASD